MSEEASQEDETSTSFHVRRAVAGDVASVGWLAEHLHPLLLAQARYRLARGLASRVDPEDLVQQVWCVCLPKLGSIRPRNGRYARVLLSFMSSTLLRIHNNLVAKHLIGKPAQAGPVDGSEGVVDPVAVVPADAVGVVTDCMRRDVARSLHAALTALSDDDKQIIVLRGIEHIPYKVLSANLGLSEGALMMRYRRALDRLRHQLPKDIIEELSDEDAFPR